MNKPVQILLLAGSLNRPSHTHASLQLAADLLRDSGAIANIWDLGDDPLPMHNPLYHRDPLSNPSLAVQRLARLAAEADAFIWGTPVYHNSFSGVLKNALDNLSMGSFEGKPVALISNGGDRSGVQPCDQLRIVARGLGADAITTQIVTIETDFALREDRYVVVDPLMRERFARLASQLIEYARLLRHMRAGEAGGVAESTMPLASR